ncbi:MAG: SIMPL domain-containing protein [Pseudomonadota bacterium]
MSLTTKEPWNARFKTGWIPSHDLNRSLELYDLRRPHRSRQVAPQPIGDSGSRLSYLRTLPLAVLVVLCSSFANTTFAATAQSGYPSLHAEAKQRTVSVSGEAERRVQPDMALLSVQVVVQSEQAAEARAEVDKVTTSALRLVRELGVADSDTDTTGLRVDPKYRWVERNREQELTGYEVSRSLELRILDLDVLGELITRLSELGVNRISPPVLGLQSRERIHQQVLAEAAANARKRAIVMAEALDAKVGEIIDLTASNAARPQAMNRQRERVSMAMESASADNAVFGASYSVGYLTLRSSVHATFALR